ncbi:MAG: 1-acyl-sn-glycerol-3-phosphate acyltransferase [Bacteroidota bacterium]
MLRLLAKFYLWLGGWDMRVTIPPEPKYLVLTAPHTSNWDFPLGISVRASIGMDIRFLGKAELFRAPFGWLFRALGGYPVVRKKNTRLVDAVVEIYDEHERFAVALAPEGTRSKVRELKTGFYHIARKANLPVYLVGFDYENKIVHRSERMDLGEDIEQETARIIDWYKNIKGKNPENGISAWAGKV